MRTLAVCCAVALAAPVEAAPIEAWRDTNILVATSDALEDLSLALDRHPVDCAAYARVAPKIADVAGRIPAIRAARERILDGTYRDWRAGHEPRLVRRISLVHRLRAATHCPAVRADDALQRISRVLVALLDRPAPPRPQASACQPALKQSFAELEVLYGASQPPDPLDAFFADVALIEKMRAIDAAPEGPCVPFGGRPGAAGDTF